MVALGLKPRPRPQTSTMTRIEHVDVTHIDAETGFAIVALPGQSHVVNVLSYMTSQGPCIKLVVLIRVFPSILSYRKFAFCRPNRDYIFGSETVSRYVGTVAIQAMAMMLHVFELEGEVTEEFVSQMKEKEERLRNQQSGKHLEVPQ